MFADDDDVRSPGYTELNHMKKYPRYMARARPVCDELEELLEH